MIVLDKTLWKEKKSDDYLIYACGWAEYKDRILTAEMIIDVIQSEYLNKNIEFYGFPELLNGSFGIIISGKQKVYLISDIMRTYPLVYFFNQETLVVTDNLIEYKRNNLIKFKIDETTCEQFLCTNYILGPFTLLKDVYSIQSGEIIEINPATKSINRTQHFQWAPYMENDDFKRDYEVESRRQEKIFLSVFRRMIKSAPHVNNWIIPLSGGYDSRTIINYLYKLGVKNVICFTYGMESNIQSEISRKVAESLGYKWYFIDYKIWIKKTKDQNTIDTYLEYGFNGSSVPHLQDFPAVYALKAMEIIGKNDIFVPGHALEVIAGSHLKLEMQNCSGIESVMKNIKSHLSGFGYYTKSRGIVFDHVKSIISEYNIDYSQMAERFDWQERQTKFIANSVKVYEYFGFGWRIPEWDMELIDYWNKIGFNYKYNRNMYKDVFKEYLVVDALKSIPFANDLVVKRTRNLKTILIDNLPFWIKKFLKKSGFTTTNYYVNEGSHLIYSEHNETTAEYLLSFNAPKIVRKYLKSYPQKQKLSNFEVNSVSTLINIRNLTDSL